MRRTLLTFIVAGTLSLPLSHPHRDIVSYMALSPRDLLEYEITDDDILRAPSDEMTFSHHLKQLRNYLDTQIAATKRLYEMLNYESTLQRLQTLRGYHKQLTEELEPLEDDLNALMDSLQSASDPTEFQNDLKAAVAAEVDFPEDRIFFLPPSHPLLLSPLRGEMAGVHSLYINNSGEPVRLILIRNNLGNFGTVRTLVHEGAHSRQSLDSYQIREPFLSRILKEGYQKTHEKEILLSLASQNSPVGAKVRDIIEEEASRIGFPAFQVPSLTDHDSETMEQRIDRVLRGNPRARLEPYMAELFVRSLSDRIGEEAVRQAVDRGDLTELRDQLGSERFSVLIHFFRRLNHLNRGNPIPFWYPLGINLAREFLLHRDITLDPSWMDRLFESLFILEELFFHYDFGDSIHPSMMSIFLDEILPIVDDYIFGEIDESSYRDRLATLVFEESGMDEIAEFIEVPELTIKQRIEIFRDPSKIDHDFDAENSVEIAL